MYSWENNILLNLLHDISNSKPCVVEKDDIIWKHDSLDFIVKSFIAATPTSLPSNVISFLWQRVSPTRVEMLT